MMPEQIIAAVCASYEITVDELRSPRRSRNLIEARRACISRLKDMDLNPSQIGRLLNRDHSAIIYHLNFREDAA